MIRDLKRGVTEEKAATDNAKVRAIVEDVLWDISARGDAAARQYSEKFDKWSPNSFRLSEAEMKACYDMLSPQLLMSPVRLGATTGRLSFVIPRKKWCASPMILLRNMFK